MKKKLLALLFVVTIFAQSVLPASAARTEMIKVGLRYGGSALFSAPDMAAAISALRRGGAEKTAAF